MLFERWFDGNLDVRQILGRLVTFRVTNSFFLKNYSEIRGVMWPLVRQDQVSILTALMQ